MSRPIYETEVDRQWQGAVAAEIGRWLNRPLEALPPLHTFDYVLPAPSTSIRRAYLEIKVRERCYALPFISRAKIDACMAFAVNEEATPLLAMAWLQSGRLGLVRLRPAVLTTAMRGGREDRDDPLDLEEVYGIDLRHFWVQDWRPAT